MRTIDWQKNRSEAFQNELEDMIRVFCKDCNEQGLEIFDYEDMLFKLLIIQLARTFCTFVDTAKKLEVRDSFKEFISDVFDSQVYLILDSWTHGDTDD